MPKLNHVGSPALIQWKGQNSPDEIETIPKKLIAKTIEGKKLFHFFLNFKILYGGESTFCASAIILKGIEPPSGVVMYTDKWFNTHSLLAGGISIFFALLGISFRWNGGVTTVY